MDNWVQIGFFFSSISTPPEIVDVTIVGGGIVGLATARNLIFRYPKAKIVVLEKEKDIVAHQTSHNSGVIHAGLYYSPGSQMAKLCVEGAKKMYQFCAEKKIPHARIGKLVVATKEKELPLLEDLYERAKANGVQGLELLNPSQVKKMEPNISVLAALHSPNTGIVDYSKVGRQLAKEFLEFGNKGEIKTGFEVAEIDTSTSEKEIVLLSQKKEPIRARHVITCAGLHADVIGRKAGGGKGPMVLPFRGTYHELKTEFRTIVKRNIYPVPDPKFPMVGVHLTPKIDGRILIGPNAALAMSQEGYSFWDFNIRDMFRFGTNMGLWKLVLGNFGVVTKEIVRDLSAKAFVAEAQKYCPSLKLEHTTTGWSGVHAVAIDPKGKIIGDFLFENGKSGKVLNVRNAPSPACTSSLAIAEAIVDRASEDFGWKNGVL